MTQSTLIIDSPIGRLLLSAEAGALTGLWMEPFEEPAEAGRRDPVLTAARRQLDAYFAGTLTAFDLPLAPAGTPFQTGVWNELQRVPYGTTVSYAELADRVGRPGHFRAVGSANGRNPISIIIPCHRVVGSNGSLTGYGGGNDRKRWLLDHEAAVAATESPPQPRRSGAAAAGSRGR
jgi:methylated-DNA-[protein]-cysteine S-methyltransferase